MQNRIEVKDKPGIFDAIGHEVLKGINDLHIKGVKEVDFIQVYNLHGAPSKKELKLIADNLLTLL